MKKIVTQELTGLRYGLKGSPLYPFVEPEGDKEDKGEYVWKEPSRKEKIKENLKSTGWFIAGVFGLIFIFVGTLTVCLGVAALAAFAVGIFWQGSTYPFFNLLTFQITGPIAVFIWLICSISYLVNEWEDIKSGFF